MESDKRPLVHEQKYQAGYPRGEIAQHSGNIGVQA
jgi:hypothetical protein